MRLCMVAGTPTPVEWIGSTRADLRSFPEAVRGVVGYALYQAKIGLRHRDVKSLRGFGSNVLEVVENYGGG